MKNANDQNFFNFMGGLDKGLYGNIDISFQNYHNFDKHQAIYFCNLNLFYCK